MMFPINKRGLTLLEVLVATLLLSVAIFAIMEAFNRSMFGMGEVEDYSLALSLAQEKLEEIQNTASTSFGSISNETKAAVSGFSSFQREVTVTTPNTVLKEVRVTTYWTVPNGENRVRLSTRIVNNP